MALRLSGWRPASVRGRLTALSPVRRAALLVLAASALFAASFAVTSSPVDAVSLKWRIYPGVVVAGLYEYGWHYNEAFMVSSYGAKDYNPVSGSTPVRIRATAASNLGGYYRYITAVWSSPCDVWATAQVWDGQVWLTLGGFELHYLHVVPGTMGATAWMNVSNDTINHQVGTVAATGTACASGGAHLHQSANLAGASYNWRNHLSNETCWILSDGGQCSGSGPWRKHTSCSTWSGTASKSGNITEYVCNTWSKESRSINIATFLVQW